MLHKNGAQQSNNQLSKKGGNYVEHRVYLCDHANKLWLIVNNKPYVLTNGKASVDVLNEHYEVKRVDHIYFITIRSSNREERFNSWLEPLPRRPQKAQYYKCHKTFEIKAEGENILGQMSIFDLPQEPKKPKRGRPKKKRV